MQILEIITISKFSLVQKCELVVDIKHLYYLRLVSSLTFRKKHIKENICTISCIHFYDLFGSKFILDPWAQILEIVRIILFIFKRIFHLNILRLCSCLIYCGKLLNKVTSLCSNEKTLLNDYMNLYSHCVSHDFELK